MWELNKEGDPESVPVKLNRNYIYLYTSDINLSIIRCYWYNLHNVKRSRGLHLCVDEYFQ